TKPLDFAFSVLLSKLSHVKKDGCTLFVTLQCVMKGNYRKNYEITKETRKRTKFTKHQNCSVILRATLNENTVLNKKQKELVHIMLKNIINKCDRIKNALNEGSNHDTTMRLLQMLEESQYLICYLLAKDRSIQSLFFIYIELAHQVAKCSKVLIVYTIYKTNLYKLPLINAIGVSNIGNAKSLNTYQIAMAWVVNEQKHIDLALQKAANNVFLAAKKMFCIWHILAQNLRTACRKFFDSNKDYNKFLLFIQKVAYSGEISKVKKAF
ncbi:39715_t:CDS:2, partial [Gigaspora margarita]